MPAAGLLLHYRRGPDCPPNAWVVPVRKVCGGLQGLCDPREGSQDVNEEDDPVLLRVVLGPVLEDVL